MKNTTKLPFYSAREHSFYIWFFTIYTSFIAKIYFHSIYVRYEKAIPDTPILCFSNHSYWWDALIPLLLNRKFFQRKARAIMEDKQIKKHSFFARIGSFSVNLDGQNLRKTLLYASEFLTQNRSLLFLYPHGKMHPPEQVGGFKKGITWILKSSRAQAIPVAYFISNHKYLRPQLFISIGDAVKDPDVNRLEIALKNELSACIEAAFSENHTFKPLR